MRDTIKMAHEADGHMNSHAGGIDMTWEGILRFAELVRADERDKWMERTAILIRGEREACAKVCEELEHKLRNTSYTPNGFSCANAIRARGETK